jgi:phosphoenolpyruvate carboxylase
MIRTKLGMTRLAVNTLGQYAGAILQANLMPPPEPTPAWRALMDSLAATSCEIYRRWVRDDKQFVAFFRQATPEQEFADLPLGSRPARRQTGGGIESLRAIPWIFAWMQNRLMLPAWLGAGESLQRALDDGQRPLIQEMLREWPFFRARLSMLEMVFAKSDHSISAHYDALLVEQELAPCWCAIARSAPVRHRHAAGLLSALLSCWHTIHGRNSPSGSEIFTPRRSICCKPSYSDAFVATVIPLFSRH